MRSKQFYVVSIVTLMLISFVLTIRRLQIKHAIADSAIGLFEKFRDTSSNQEVPEDDGVLIEHTKAGDHVVPHRIGMVTMLIGDINPTFERALKTHLRHGEIQGYETFTMRSKVLDMMYNKPMFILNILMEEMKKPYHQRLEWLFWFDCDSVLLNPRLGLSSFLPPSGFGDSNALVTEDGNGLNNGVFFIRVCAWSIEIMSANVAYRTFNPKEKLTFQDQSALSNLFHMEKFSKEVVYYPQRWFNAYQSGLINETIHANQVRRGDLIVHFAGVGNKIERMDYWCDIAEKHMPDWEVDIIHTSYPDELAEFWREKRGRDENEKQELENVKALGRLFVTQMEHNMTMYQEKLTEDERNKIHEGLHRLREEVDSKNKGVIWACMKDLEEFSKKLRVIEKETRKDAIKSAHATMHKAEKVGINTDHLRELLVEGVNWESIENEREDLQGKVEMEEMKEMVIAEVQGGLEGVNGSSTSSSDGQATSIDTAAS